MQVLERVRVYVCTCVCVCVCVCESSKKVLCVHVCMHETVNTYVRTCAYIHTYFDLQCNPSVKGPDT